LILPVAGSGLSRRSRVAASWPQIGCAQVRPGPEPVSLACCGRRTRSWAVRFGLAGLALFAVSVVLLMQAGRAPG
jgi:hypothetical protein